MSGDGKGLRAALEKIANKHYAEEYHDGTPTGPDALREIRKIAHWRY
jgi:hypothetical protein